VHLVAPSEAPLMALPKAWTPGTEGVVRGELVQVTLESEEDLEKHAGTLAGKMAFDAVGLPGFQFIQDDVEYSSLTHHTNLDVYDRVKREDLMQAAAVLTTFAYHAATRDGLLPRKPMPDPERER